MSETSLNDTAYGFSDDHSRTEKEGNTGISSWIFNKK